MTRVRNASTMSKNLTEEKQKIRVEIMAEIAKNEQDLEQCNEKTGSYNREFLYNVRDLEQICSITECPLTSLQLKEFGIFAQKKIVAQWWKRMKNNAAATIEKKDDEKMGEEEEERCSNEEEVFPFLALPKELQREIYRYFGLEARRALRMVEELEKIEMTTKYRYESLVIIGVTRHVILGAYNNDVLAMKCYVPHSEVEKELEIMAKNCQFDGLCITSALRNLTNAVQSIKAIEIGVRETPSFDDSNLQSIVQNKKKVNIIGENAITENGIFWIYEKMRDCQLDLKNANFVISESVRWNFLEKFGTFDRETMTFTGTNPKQRITHHTDFVRILEGKLKMFIDKRDTDGVIGTVIFVQLSD